MLQIVPRSVHFAHASPPLSIPSGPQLGGQQRVDVLEALSGGKVDAHLVSREVQRELSNPIEKDHRHVPTDRRLIGSGGECPGQQKPQAHKALSYYRVKRLFWLRASSSHGSNFGV